MSETDKEPGTDGAAEDGPLDDAYMITAQLVDGILAAVELGSQARLVELLSHLHEADLADLLEQIGPANREKLLAVWGDKFDGAVLSELEEGVRDQVVRLLDRDVLAKAVKDLEIDDLVYLVEDLEEPEQEEVLETLDEGDRVAVEASLQYPEDSAGRLMSREMVTVPQHWTVGEAIDYMRASETLPEDFYKVILVDSRMHVVGTVPLGTIMAHRREEGLMDIADLQPHSFHVDDTDEDVAYAFNQYRLISAPVLDGHERLVGVITIDDAVEMMEEAAEEDMKRLAGVGDEEITDTVGETLKARLPWLVITLVAASVSASVISVFEETIEALVALAILMPIVAAVGGNAGTQTLTVAVRALATRDVTAANAWRIILREVAVAFGNGLFFAVVVGTATAFVFGSGMLALVIAAAMVTSLTLAGIMGILVPITLSRLGADPAVASPTFVTTTVDVVSFFTFLGLATWALI